MIVVDKFGKGNYTKIQDAIDAVPLSNRDRVHIWVSPGVYRERVVVPPGKPFITLIGSSEVRKLTVITGMLGGSILDSATVSIFASDFIGHNLTIQVTNENCLIGMEFPSSVEEFFRYLHAEISNPGMHVHDNDLAENLFPEHLRARISSGGAEGVGGWSVVLQM